MKCYFLFYDERALKRLVEMFCSSLDILLLVSIDRPP
jgi:hypothetical protein